MNIPFPPVIVFARLQQQNILIIYTAYLYQGTREIWPNAINKDQDSLKRIKWIKLGDVSKGKLYNNEVEVKLLSDFMKHYQDEVDRMTGKIQ